ncbi:hypothetical protein SmJEL517_g05631 [Synchytrium microbalum]|uniref:RNA helicase n=1 Tax=Synchytrium microbalum TaxID=1806994 RepID=A0A507BUF3_9FUNG|nr:uncharacterized protein SmJEL517_g05631 [Synchytrium microbalum]TPX30918.1 hypothetical protein SmJEL517_g05631 [Synchytrium microbalum]
MKRHIHLHVGPTNSGKTHEALSRLSTATTATYLGPLRLLAHEIYERLNKNGVACSLITGEERREVEGSKVTSCTVEMAPLFQKLDVAVIDEGQMMSDDSRGFAWTNSILGLQAKEIHICGEESIVDRVQAMCDVTGDSMTVRHYKRLTSLSMSPHSLNGRLDKIQKGDCVVTFSRMDIFGLKREIETATGLRCAVIYGGLPPEIRSEQARLFNDPASGFDVLVASDAIGMGLNLNIRRIIFERVEKYNGVDQQVLTVSQIKQIAGRAGRFNTIYSAGEVTTLEKPPDHSIVARALKSPVVPIRTAGLHPLLEQIEAFKSRLPDTPLALLLDYFEHLALANIGSGYFLCNLRTQKALATLLERLTLSFSDRYTMIMAPVNPEDGKLVEAMGKFASAHSTGYEVRLREIVPKPHGQIATSEELRRLESIHKIIMLFLWLSYRFPKTFVDMDHAWILKSEYEYLITDALRRLRSIRPRRRERDRASPMKERGNV